MKEYIHRGTIMNSTVEREVLVPYEDSDILALQVVNLSNYRFVVVVGKKIEYKRREDRNEFHASRVEPIQMNHVPDKVFSDAGLEGPIWYLPQSYLTDLS